MTRFELKKIFSRRINQIVLLVMAAIVAVCVFVGLNSVSYSVYDGNPETGTYHLSGHAAAVRLRADAAQYEGELTADVLRRVIEDNARIHSMPEAQSKSIPELNYVYTFTQGYRDIRELCGTAYTPFNEFDYFAIDNLEPGDADRFYSLRIQQLKDWLNQPEVVDMYTSAEHEFLISRYEALETPMLYRPTLGWDAVFEQTPSMLMFMCFILGFLLAGVFADEAHLKTDAILFSSFHGRKKAVWAKIRAGIIIANAVYWSCMLVLSAVLLLALGAQGWDCPVQVTGPGWKYIYNMSVLQKYLLTLACGWVGVTVIAMVSMLISAKTNSATLSVAVPIFIIFLPQILSAVARSANIANITEIMGLMPDQLLQVNTVMGFFNLYSLGGKIFAQLEITPWLHLAISVLLVPLVYQVYRRKNPA